MSRAFIEPRGEPLATFKVTAAGVLRLQSKRVSLSNATVLRASAGYEISGPIETFRFDLEANTDSLLLESGDYILQEAA